MGRTPIGIPSMKNSESSRIWQLFVSWFSAGAGTAALGYSLLIMFNKGVYLSERWNPGQLDAGFMPVLFLIGGALLAFGLIGLWLRR